MLKRFKIELKELNESDPFPNWLPLEVILFLISGHYHTPTYFHRIAALQCFALKGRKIKCNHRYMIL